MELYTGIIGNVTLGGQLLTHWTAREVKGEQACSDVSNRVTVRGSRAAEADLENSRLSLVPLTFPNFGAAKSRASKADKPHSPRSQLHQRRAQHSHATPATAADTQSEPRQDTFLPTFYTGLLSSFRAFCTDLYASNLRLFSIY